MLAKWNIYIINVHLLVLDNAANIISGANMAGISSEGCFIHTLQLAIHYAILSQRAVLDMLAICRRIVTHFCHSALACSKLKVFQADNNLPQHKLVQDVKTRWNSTYYMLQRIFEQKRAVVLYSTENDIPVLTANQWDLIEKVIRLLQPFEELTLQASSEKASISIVIPFVATLVRYLEKEENDQGVKTMKKELKHSTEARFEKVQTNMKHVIATILDPRYKMAFIKDALRTVAKGWLMEEICDTGRIPLNQPEIASRPQSSQQPSFRKEIHDIWQCFMEITKSAPDAMPKDGNVQASTATKEVNEYLSTDLIARKEDPLQWWKLNMAIYPSLAKLARRYLAAPASSIFSERMFSEACQIYDEERNHLLPRNVEKLLFLHKNLPSDLNYQY